ncbi:hypothetical protein EDB86DRAFT_924463 [Lactarius hatsudake]|nr:hypothetical protein EDB86DRAFT_924463 [Lactarius hatsudake]
MSSCLPSMASSEADGSQPPTEDTPPVQEEHVTTRIPAQPLADPHTYHHDPRAASESIRESAERSIPKPTWLISKKLAPSSSVGTNRRSISCANPARPCASQEPPNASPPLHDASSAPAGYRPPAERSGKRKAAEELRRAAAAAMGRGRPMFIDVDESSKIMRNSEESHAAALASQRRRVTVAGGEACEAGLPKRARTAAATTSDDSNRDTHIRFSRRRKIGALPAASSSVSGIKGKGVCATSAASGVTRTPRAAANSNSCGLGLLGVVNQEVPSVPHGGTIHFSAPHGATPLGETAAPSQETARADAEPATMPVSGDKTADETQPTTDAQPMEWAAASSSGEWTTGNARPATLEMSAPPQALPLSEELGFSPDPVPQGWDPSDLMDDDSDSSSGVPLSLLVSPLRNTRKRAFPTEEGPLRSKKGKGKGKGKAKACASEPNDGSSYGDHSEKEASSDTDFGIPVPRRKLVAPATPRLSNSKGKSPKAKTPARIAHVERNTSTSPRKRLGAQNPYTSEEDSSDTDVVPQVRIVRINRPRTKSLWRVVKPPKNRARPEQRTVAPSSRPRVWAGVRRRSLLDPCSTTDPQRGRAKMSYWPCSLPSRNTRTVLHGKVSKTLRSYSQGRKATLGWAGGTKTLGRAAKSSSQSFAKPTLFSPILRTSPPSQLPRTRPPTEGTQLRMHSLHQTTLPTHSTTMERHPWSQIPKPTLHLLVRRTPTLRVSA